jgi:NodT family efflux transporter outer membrane factor (OMF) lipoprotein
MMHRACAATGTIVALLPPAAALVALLLSGCNLAPHYATPATAPPASYKEAVPGGDASAQGWKLAEPRDAVLRNGWWRMYQDPQLNELESQVAISNQSIIAAAANYRAAHALVLEAQAQLFPTFTLAPSATREKSSAALAQIGSAGVSGASTATSTAGGVPQSAVTAPHNIFALPLEATYQLDLWGSVRNTVAANRFSAQASAATLANTVLSTQSTLAEDYFQLRVADEQRRILESTVADDRESLHLVRTLVASGVDSEADVASAESALESAQASATDAGVARAQYEHAIAVLIGVSPAAFSIPYQHLSQPLPVIPVGLPSDLLERRPDIATAERQVAETNAQIGVARAAFFPALTLSASGGYESTAVSNLFNAPNRFWSVGPSISQTVFDAGAHRAALMQAHALNDSQVATYRQTVLSAFQSVEDNLAALRIYAVELRQAHQATMAAKKAVELTVVLFRNGVDSYVNLITVQNAFLAARENELQVQLRQLIASVTLINALGGGWSTAQREQDERTAMRPPASSIPAPAPPQNSHGSANPPAIPLGEITPDEIIKLNNDVMGPDPADSPPATGTTAPPSPEAPPQGGPPAK